MKFHRGFFLISILGLSATTSAEPTASPAERPSTEEVRQMISGAKREHYAELQAEMNRLKGRRSSLKTQEKKEKQAMVRLAKKEKKLLRYFDEYIKLMEAKYVNRDGDHEPGLEIGEEDVRRINMVFASFLSQSPLSGIVSAGQAIQSLKKGRTLLETRIDQHASPRAENNSTLGVIAERLSEVERQIGVLEIRGKRVNYRFRSSRGIASKRR